MDTRNMAKEYRQAHWAGIMNERRESGLSVREYCASAGFHENIYYYWQRKLREVACNKLANSKSEQSNVAPYGFTEVKLLGQPALTAQTISWQYQVNIEVVGARIYASSEYPVDKLVMLMREAVQLC